MERSDTISGKKMFATFLLIDLFFTLKMDTLCSSEVPVKPYQTTLIQIIEGKIFHNQNFKRNKTILNLFPIFFVSLTAGRLMT
jgi:hypothetical protein